VNVFKEQLLSLINHSRPPIEIFIDSDDSPHIFELDTDEGWIYRLKPDRNQRRMCWLPHKRRHVGHIACWGQKLVIGALSGIVTILDFSNV
jgi:hypothetical protein